MHARMTEATQKHMGLVHREVRAAIYGNKALKIAGHPELAKHKEDLVQAGTVGLLEHARRYVKKKAKFSTLGVKRIRRHVLRAGKSILGGGLGVGERMLSKLNKLKKLPKTVRLETPAKSGTLRLRPEVAKLMGQGLGHAEAKIDLEKLLKKLSARSRTVIRLRFLEEQPVKAIAKQLKLTTGRVKKIQTEAMAKLRSHVRKEAA